MNTTPGAHGAQHVNRVVDRHDHHAGTRGVLDESPQSSVAGATAIVPSAALRAARMQIVGSGQGSVSARDILAELPELATLMSAGTFAVDAVTTPLRDVAQAWADAPTSSRRIVLVP